MRRAARVDANHNDVVKALQAIGCSVAPLSTVGGGMPDLLVGYRGRNFLIEVKDGEKVPSKRKLTDDQITWIGAWKGQTAIAYSIEDALNIVRGEK